ncbi:MAG: hypothetical protein K0R29_969 [Pseudobdellovibrio sp.]|nr:hypothetical protein [Pseudobdellovibrio sp.]
MVTSIESRLWLAVHLLYPNASQAFDVYQAVVLQSEHSIANNDIRSVFLRLVQVYEKIPAIGSNLAFYEFEYEEIDQWKVIYKNSQKTQLIIFVGVLIFELKISEIAGTVKLSPEKAQFLFHQIFKKLASTSQKLKYNEQLEFKKQNDNKISYLFTYENLVDYCLGQLSAEDTERVEAGLKLYPMLQIAKEEYTRIISQIQNLKVQKERAAVSSDAKPNLKIVNNDVTSTQYLAKGFTKNQIRIAGGAAVVILAVVLAQPVSMYKKWTNRHNTVVLHEIDKPQLVAKNDTPSSAASQTVAAATPSESTPAPAPVTAASPSSTPSPANSANVQPAAKPAAPAPVAVAQTPAPAPAVTPGVKPAVAAASPAQPADSAAAAIGSGGLYRGTLFVADLTTANEKIKNRMNQLGAVKAGEVELGWLKSPNLAYYHYIITEKNMQDAEAFMRAAGSLHVKFEPHPRKVPAGSKRFIIEVKQK